MMEHEERPAKVAIDLDKHRWHPSPLVGQIVLLSTVDAAGQPNIAPKSWVTMVAFTGPVLAFGCNTAHTTYLNAIATGAFVVNIPGEDLVERIWAMPASHRADRIARSGLTLAPSRVVPPPLIVECRAHLECRTDAVQQYGDEVLIFGQVVAASMNASCLDGSPGEQYASLDPIVFLENGVYGTIGAASTRREVRERS
ncbi:MAG: flavin reductase family protein [Thermomicrobiales bacterium]